MPADCRRLSSFELHCDESAITGDPLPTPKNAGASVSDVISVIDREGGGRENLAEAGVDFHPLMKASDLVGASR